MIQKALCSLITKQFYNLDSSYKNHIPYLMDCRQTLSTQRTNLMPYAIFRMSKFL